MPTGFYSKSQSSRLIIHTLVFFLNRYKRGHVKHKGINFGNTILIVKEFENEKIISKIGICKSLWLEWWHSVLEWQSCHICSMRLKGGFRIIWNIRDSVSISPYSHMKKISSSFKSNIHFHCYGYFLCHFTHKMDVSNWRYWLSQKAYFFLVSKI